MPAIGLQWAKQRANAGKRSSRDRDHATATTTLPRRMNCKPPSCSSAAASLAELNISARWRDDKEWQGVLRIFVAAAARRHQRQDEPEVWAVDEVLADTSSPSVTA